MLVKTSQEGHSAPRRWLAPSRTGSPSLLARENPSVLVKAGSAQDRLGLVSLRSLVPALHCAGRVAPRPPTLCGRSLAQGKSLALGAPALASVAAERLPRCAASQLGTRRGSGSEAVQSTSAQVPSCLSLLSSGYTAGPLLTPSASPGSTQTLSYSLHKTPTLKAQLGVWSLRRRPRKNEIEKPVGGPSAKRRLPFVCISAQVLKSST